MPQNEAVAAAGLLSGLLGGEEERGEWASTHRFLPCHAIVATPFPLVPSSCCPPMLGHCLAGIVGRLLCLPHPHLTCALRRDEHAASGDGSTVRARVLGRCFRVNTRGQCLGSLSLLSSLQLNLALLKAGHAAEAVAVLLHVATPRHRQVWMYAVLG